jgi:hypothetical protein
MMSYGIMKILGMQFHTVLPFSVWAQPLQHLSGNQLTWAFLGYSTWLQVLLGIFEFVPATLLLFRRTALIGAILLFPMSLSVFLINYALHLWYNTQIISLIIVLLNLSLFLFDWQRLRQILDIALGTAISSKRFRTELIVAIILVSAIVIKKATADYGKEQSNVLTGDWFGLHPNEYILISEKINEVTMPHHMVKAYFGPWGMYSEMNDSTNNKDGYTRYTIDEKKGTLNISAPFRTEKWTNNYYYMRGDYQYEIRDGQLILSQKIDDTTRHSWIFKRKVMDTNKR